MGGIGETARLVAELDLKDNFSKGIGSATRSLGGLQSSLGRMGRGVGQVGAGLARLGTVAAAAAAGGLAAVVTTAATMEEAFIGVQKTVDETAQFTFEELRDVLRTMSSETGTAFEELSRIGEIGGALGVPIASLDEFIDVVNRLGVSTDLSVDDAATALGHLGTVLHLSGEDYRDLADGLVALGNAGASSEGQIVAIAERFAVAGSRAGLSTQEILALGSAVASMGIEVEAGGTALSNTFNQIAVAIGTGGKEVEAFTDLLGINAKEFRRRWETDALGTFQEFLREVDKLPAIEQAVALEAAGITGARQQAAVGALADGYAELGRQLEVVEGREGALNVESDKFFASTSNAFRKLRENVRLSAAAIGNELLPITNELITEFVDFLNLDSTQKGLKTFAQDLAGGIRGLVKELKDADFSGLIGTLKLIGDAGKKVVDIFLSLPPGIQAAIVTGAAINKLSGGLLGAGAGNIVGGAGSLFFDRFLARGSGPQNPVWVQSVGGIGGPGGAAPIVGAGGAVRLALGAAGAIALGAELGKFIGKQFFFDPTVTPAVEFEQTQFNELVNRNKPDELRHAIETLDENIKGFQFGRDIPGVGAGIGFLEDFLVGDQITILEGQRADLAKILAELERQRPTEVASAGRGTSAKLRESGPMGAAKKIPDTAMTVFGAGGTALPDTAMSNLGTTATEIKKIPSILTRQDRNTQIVAQRVSELRSTMSQGLSGLGGIMRTGLKPEIHVHVHMPPSQISVSDIERKLSSSAFARGQRPLESF